MSEFKFPAHNVCACEGSKEAWLKLYECYDQSCTDIFPTLQLLHNHTLRHLGFETPETDDLLEDRNQEIDYQ